jgi:TPR repeat protein
VDAGLDRMALECIGKWRFTPGEKDGQAVTVISTIEMNFKIGRTNGPPAFDEERALKIYQKEAMKGDADAQYSAGALYYRKKDFSSARDWLLKAAVQNLPDAFYLLGVMYERGEGVPANSLEAQHWYDKALSFGKPASGTQ